MERIKRPPKTVKERKFVKEYLKNGGNATQAAMKAYDASSYNSAHVIGAENIRKLTISDILDKAGLTDEKIGSVLTEAAEATKPISATSGRDASEASMDFIEVPDWNARLKSIELAGKMKGHFIEKREDKHSGNITYTWANDNNNSVPATEPPVENAQLPDEVSGSSSR